MSVGSLMQMTVANDHARARIRTQAGSASDSLTADAANIKAEVDSLNFFYGKLQALKNINMVFPANQVTAIIGPSGCGKSTLLRCFNRIHDLYPETRYEGQIILQPSGINLIGPETDPLEMRMRMGIDRKSVV